MSKRKKDKVVEEQAAVAVDEVPVVAEVAQVALPEEEPVDPTPGEKPAEGPETVEVVGEPAAPAITPEALALAEIERLNAKIATLTMGGARRRVASGSKARPNVTYTLLAKPPKWAGTPQVGQLLDVLFEDKFVEAHKQDDGSIKVSEPEVFAQIAKGASDGRLRTKQSPVRVLQYYRSRLLNMDALRWQ